MKETLFLVLGSGIMIVGVAYSIILHEIAHGLVALWWGDTTARDHHRLSLSPLSHIDPLGTVVIPLFMYLATGSIFGWAKPVPINPSRFRNWRWGNITVALAGATANILIAAFVIVVSLIYPHKILFQLMITNLFLAFFNLLPIPPLDGFRVIMSLFPAQWSTRIEPYLFPIGIVGLYLVVQSPLFSLLYDVFTTLVRGLMALVYR